MPINNLTIFEEITNKLCLKISVESGIMDTFVKVRSSLTFNPNPNFSELATGHVDCLGASIILFNVFKKKLSHLNTSIVSVPRMPWMDPSINNDRHTALVVRFDGSLMILDPTPIDSYGAGMVTPKIKLDEYKIKGNNYRLKHPKPIKEFHYWESHLFPDITILSTEDIGLMLEIDNYNGSINTHVVAALTNSPSGDAPGWACEYWRILANQAFESKKYEMAKLFYSTALNTCWKSPYVLNEFKLKLKSWLSAEEIKAIDSLIYDNKKRLMELNEIAINAWESYIEQNAQRLVMANKITYYSRCIYWKKMSTLKLKNM